MVQNALWREDFGKKACLHFSYKNILLKYSKNMKWAPKSWHRPFHPLIWYLTWNECKNHVLKCKFECKNHVLKCKFILPMPFKLLTAHKLAKMKRTFPTCHCHEIYREEEVGLKSSNYTFKITIFVNMWNLGQFR